MGFRAAFKNISAHIAASVYGRREPATSVVHSVAVNLQASAGTNELWMITALVPPS